METLEEKLDSEPVCARCGEVRTECVCLEGFLDEDEDDFDDIEDDDSEEVEDYE